MYKKMQESVSMMSELTKEKKPKKKLIGKGRRVQMKDMLRFKAIRKYKKDALIEDLIVNFPAFERELKKFYGGENPKHALLSDREDIVELLTNGKFSKALIKAMKEISETDYVPAVTLFAVGDMYVNGDEAFSDDEGLIKSYMKVFDKFFGGKIKKLAKAAKISKPDALALLLTSLTFKDVRNKYVFRRSFTFLNLIYGMEELTEKKVKLILEKCYGKRMYMILSAILNESPKKNEENFSIVTNAALSILNKMDREDLKELLKNYAKRRRQNGKAPRRISLMDINAEDYRNIHRAIEKLTRTGFAKELFM
jgi:hypothetical protein